jgi:V8-like Glu-specific endopeptidase
MIPRKLAWSKSRLSIWVTAILSILMIYQTTYADFGELIELSTENLDFTELPYSATVKLKTDFPDGISEEGSGVLIDPYHVLTAAHCVYNLSKTNWADKISVIPADHWDPYGYEPPFGRAHDEDLICFSGFIDNGDDWWDIGIIELDRPIGALTKYHSIAVVNDPNQFIDGIFYMLGYPGGPYNAYKMHYTDGNFDDGQFLISGSDYSWSLPGNEGLLYADLTIYGGLSGSGVYYIKDGKRYVTAIAVVQDDTFSRSVYARITDAKLREIKDIINERTPYAPDLIPLQVLASPEVVAGMPLGSVIK